MSQDEHNKQNDITFIVELLNKESPEKYGIYWCLSGVTLVSKFLKSQVTGSFLNCPQIAVQSFPKLPCLYRPAVHT